jgi:hypothetical protein
MSADGASGFGLKGDLFIVDEVSQWRTAAAPTRL